MEMAETEREFVEQMDRLTPAGDTMSVSDRDRLFTLARRGAEMQWRPIEAAPREGGPILLFEPLGDEDQIGVGYYEPVTDHEGTEWLTFWETGVRCDATHWMPLPPPPEKDTQS